MRSTRCGKLVGRRYGGASGRAADLAQVRPNPQRTYDRPDTGKVGTLTCGGMSHRKDDGRDGGVRRHADTEVGRIHWAGTKFFPNIFGTRRRAHVARTPVWDSGTEHHPEPDHPRPTEEATVAVPTPNRFWRMMTDPGFPSPASNPAPFMVTAEAFLDLTSQVQALAGMVQTIVPYLPHLVHSMAHQSAPPTVPPQTESPAAPNRGIPPDVEPPQPQVVEARTASPTPTPARSQSRSYNPVPTEPDFDTLSTDTADSLREQVRRVHQRLDEV
ncbi:hypothetical protein BHE74_00024279 [Ensete ventricosum]|nr:hypothetical protein BHE74_00024279 [Ensete ventricosum]